MSNRYLRDMDKGKIIELTEQLEELTKGITIVGDKPEDMPDTLPIFEAIWWEVKHCQFCLYELGKAQSNMESLQSTCIRSIRYKAASKCRSALRLLRRRALSKDYGHGADLE